MPGGKIDAPEISTVGQPDPGLRLLSRDLLDVIDPMGCADRSTSLDGHCPSV